MPLSPIRPNGRLAFRHSYRIPLQALALLILTGAPCPQAAAQRSTILDSLERLAEKAPDPVTRANLNLSAGEYCLGKERYADAEKYLDTALGLYKAQLDLRGEAKCYNQLGVIHEKLAEYSEAQRYYEQAERIFRQKADGQGLAAALQNLSSVHEALGHLAEASTYAREALETSKANGDPAGMSKAYLALGNMAYYQGNYAEALTHYKASLAISEKEGDLNMQADARANMANIHVNQGRYPEALEETYAVMKIYETTGSRRGLASAYQSLGTIQYYTSQFDQALESFKTAVTLCEETGDKEHAIGLYKNIGTLYAIKGDLSQALVHAEKSLQLSEAIGYQRGIIVAQELMGQLYKDQGDYESALATHLSALRLKEAMGETGSLAFNYIKVGDIHVHLGNLPMARQYLDKSLEMALKAGKKQIIINSYQHLVELDTLEGNTALALAHLKMYHAYEDSLLNEENNRAIAELNVRYETAQKDRKIELLNRDNRIKALQVEKQRLAITESGLREEKNRNAIALLTTSARLRELELTRTQEDLSRQQAEAKAQQAEMRMLSAEKELRENQLARQKLLRTGLLAGSGLLLLFGLMFVRSLKLRKQVEKQGAILQERRRISADLHDDIGTGLSKISLLSDMLQQDVRTPEARKEAEKIASTAKELLQSIGEIIWALNANNDHLDNLVAYIRRYAVDYFDSTPVNLRIHTPASIPDVDINGESRRNVFFAVKEALHNVVKHAQARHAELTFSLQDHLLTIVVRDDGKGLPDGELNRFGNGIRNMKSRMEKIHGQCTIENHAGTRITLALPV